MEILDKRDASAIVCLSGLIDDAFTNFNSSVCSDCPVHRDKFGGCCHSCAEKMGWFQFIAQPGTLQDYPLELHIAADGKHDGFPAAKEKFDALCREYGFDERFGFLDPTLGCRLPRHLRSFTCLHHCCYPFCEQNPERREHVESWALRIKEIRRKHPPTLI